MLYKSELKIRGLILFHRPEDISCTFELGECQWTPDNASYSSWMRHSGSTPSRDARPANDSRGGKVGFHPMAIDGATFPCIHRAI